MTGTVEKWNWSEAELGGANIGEQEARFLLLFSIFPSFQYSIVSNKNNLINTQINTLLFILN